MKRPEVKKEFRVPETQISKKSGSFTKTPLYKSEISVIEVGQISS